MKPQIKSLLALIGMSVACVSALAGVSADEAAKLKTTLMPMGGERAGNAAGTIPAWTGAALPDAGGNGGRRSNPFAADKPLYSVTAQNLSQYANLLSDGQQAMFKRYPNYRIDVYPSRRTAV